MYSVLPAGQRCRLESGLLTHPRNFLNRMYLLQLLSIFCLNRHCRIMH